MADKLSHGYVGKSDVGSTVAPPSKFNIGDAVKITDPKSHYKDKTMIVVNVDADMVCLDETAKVIPGQTGPESIVNQGLGYRGWMNTNGVVAG